MKWGREGRCFSWEGRTVETLLIRHVIHQQNTHGTSVVGGGDGAEALLSRGVPYLQLNALAVELDRADLEVDADGRDEGGREGVFAETQETAGFADARVAYEKQLNLQGKEERLSAWVLARCLGLKTPLRCRFAIFAGSSVRERGPTYKKIIVSCSRHVCLLFPTVS